MPPHKRTDLHTYRRAWPAGESFGGVSRPVVLGMSFTEISVQSLEQKRFFVKPFLGVLPIVGRGADQPGPEPAEPCPAWERLRQP